MAKPLNVLFITPDQWRADSLSARGHPVVRTPHLDALAADGVLFANHFVQCSPCGPSRASLLTGMYMMNHRSVRNGSPRDARFTNIAREVPAAGYDPALIGYTDTSLDPRADGGEAPVPGEGYEGLLPGFTALLRLPTHPTAWLDHLAAKGYEVTERPYDMYGPVGGHRAPGDFGPYDAPARYRAEDSDTAFVTDAALDYIARQGDTPWFLHLVFLRPHPPYIAPEPYNRMYDPASVPAPHRAATPEDEARVHPFVGHCLTRRGFTGTLGEDDLRKLRATYYGLITEVDDNIGRIVAALKASGQYDHTLIVVTSDHGDTLGDHWLIGKENYFDATFHVPLIVRAPGPDWDAGRGRVVEAFSENVDVMPTILDLMGRDAPVQCDGHSLGAFLAGGEPEQWRAEAHWEFDFREVDDATPEETLGLAFEECALSVIRGPRYKYIHFAGLAPLLFDLEADPHEMDDLAGDPAHAHVVLEYAQKMLSWRMSHGERTLTGLKLTPSGLVELDRERRYRSRR